MDYPSPHSKKKKNMANICNSAIVVNDKSSFNKIVSYFSSSRFEKLVEKKDLSTEMTGAEYTMFEYVIRVESKWGPEDIVFEKVSKLVSEEITVYSNTEGAFWTGITTFKDGVLVSAKEIPADIREHEFRKILKFAFKDPTWFIEGETGTLIFTACSWFDDSWRVSEECFDNWTKENPVILKKDYGRGRLGVPGTFADRINEFYEKNNI